MKNKIINISFITIFVFLFSCTDLDLQPVDSVVPETFFSDDSAYRQFIAKVYAGLAVTGQQGPAGKADITSLDEGFSNYWRQYWQFQELTTDEAVIAWNDEGLYDLHNHAWTDANQFVNAMYYRIFFQISQANEFLNQTTPERLAERNTSDALQTEVDEYRAEARFLRALSLWHGIDLFGDIPFYTEEFGIGSALPPLSSRAEVFNFIVSELSAVETELPEPRGNQYGRVDKAAVWMLQSRLFLNAEIYTGKDNYSEAADAVQKVINSNAYTLSADYQNLFNADNHSSEEIIYAIPFDGLSTQTWGGMTFLCHAPVGGSMNDNPIEEFGINGGWSGIRTTSALVEKFPDPTGAVDSRAIFYTDGQSLEINDVGTFTDGYAVPKFINLTSEGLAGSDLTHPDTDFPMFRLAEAYLTYAEAVRRGGGGDIATAVGYVNELRQRAYGNTAGNITETDLTLEFILEERSRELYFEAVRRTDLIRFGQFTTNGIWPWKGGVKEGSTTGEFRKVLPFPSAELLSNTNLVQKPGY